MLEIDAELIVQVAAVVFGLLAIYFGAQFALARQLLRELGEAFIATEKYLDNPDPKQLKEIIAEWQDVVAAGRSLVNLTKKPIVRKP